MCVINEETSVTSARSSRQNFIVVFFVVWVKLVALKIKGRYETEIGTLQWYSAMAPRPLPKVGRHPPPPNHSTLQWLPTMGPTTSIAPCNGTLVPRPIRQSGSSPSPLLEVRAPIAIAIWGKTKLNLGSLS